MSLSVKSMDTLILEYRASRDLYTKEALNDGTITPEEVVEDTVMRESKKLLEEVHRNKIRRYLIPSSGQIQYKTAVRLENGKTKYLVANTERALIKKLIVHYNLDDGYKQTMNWCWEHYLKESLKAEQNKTSNIRGNSPNTLLRLEQAYNKYLKGKQMVTVSMKYITVKKLEDYCNDLISSEGLTRADWSKINTILNIIFETAIREDVIMMNPFKNMRKPKNFAQTVTKPESDRYFNAEELAHLKAWMMDEYKRTGNIACIAVLIQAVTGLRAGELEALRWQDIGKETIHIWQQQVYDRRSNTFRVVKHTKGFTDRHIYVTPAFEAYLEILKKRDFIHPEYIFADEEGQLITTRDINYILEKYAAHTGSTVKRSHCLRRTYATLLSLAGVNNETLQKWLGHSDIETTKGYICASKENENMKEIQKNVFNSIS